MVHQGEIVNSRRISIFVILVILFSFSSSKNILFQQMHILGENSNSELTNHQIYSNDATEQFNFDPSWTYTSNGFWNGFFGGSWWGWDFGFNTVLNYSLEAMVELPIALLVNYPKIIQPGSTGIVNVSLDESYTLAMAACSLDITHDSRLTAGPNVYEKQDDSAYAGDLTLFVNSLGEKQDNTVIVSYIFAQQHINNQYLNIDVYIRFDITMFVESQTSFETDLEIYGIPLTSEIQDHLLWNGTHEVHYYQLEVNDQRNQDINILLKNTKTIFKWVNMTIESFGLSLWVNDHKEASVDLSIPPLVLADYDAPITPFKKPNIFNTDEVYSFNDTQISIRVQYPYYISMYQTPVILLVLVPTILGLVYGKQKEKGSVKISLGLAGIILFASILSIGFEINPSMSAESIARALSTALIPAEIYPDSLFFVFGFTPWVCTGLVLGGVSKSYKSGIFWSIAITLAVGIISFYATSVSFVTIQFLYALGLSLGMAIISGVVTSRKVLPFEPPQKIIRNPEHQN